MAKSDGVVFTRGAAERIANAVRIVEIGERDGGGLEMADGGVQQSPKILKLATFTGAWSVDTAKVVTLTGSTQTASVLNMSRELTAITAQTAQSVIIGKMRGSWYLLEARNTLAMWHGVTHATWYPSDSATVYISDLLGNETGDTITDVANEHGPVFANIPVVVARIPGCNHPVLVSSQMPPVLQGTASGSWWKDEEKSVQITIGDDTTSIMVQNDFSDVDADGSYPVAVAWTNGSTTSLSGGFGWRLIAAACPPPE